MIPGRWGLLVAAIAGLLMSLAFPPVGFGPYAAGAVGLKRKKALARGKAPST